MADPNNPQSQGQMRQPGSAQIENPLETQVGSDAGGSYEPGLPKDQQQGLQNDERGMEVELGGGMDPKITIEKTAEDVAKENAEREGDGTPGIEKLDLPEEFKPEEQAKFDETFKTEDGGWNLNNLSQDFFSHAKVNWENGEITGGIPERTLKYLETQGVSRETAQSIAAGQVALGMQRNAEVFGRAGGKPQYDAAIKWAREGKGYTDAQRQSYNDALNSGDPARRDDAIDALMSRFKKAGSPNFRAPSPHQAKPTRSTTEAGGGKEPGAEEKYPNYAAYQKDLREARRTGNQELLDKCRRKGRASGFF